MKPTNPTLDALLASRKFYMVDLFTITLVDGTVLRYCSGDQDITDQSNNVYSSGGVSGTLMQVDSSSMCQITIGTSAQTMILRVLPRQGTINGIPFISACRYGLFDGSILRRYVAVMPTYGNTAAGLVLMFLGRIAEIDVGDLEISMNINSPMELFNYNMPRNLFQAGCANSLYDASCTVNPASYAQNYTIGAGSTTTLLLLSGSFNPVTGYFDQGRAKITSGVNNEQVRSIRSWTQGSGGSLGTVFVWPPLYKQPAAGDTLTLYPGCNKSPTDVNGCSKFNNIANFRGMPDVPQPETAT